MKHYTTCHTCGKDFVVIPARIKRGVKFCSKECQNTFFAKNRVITNCKHCGKEFEVKKSRIKAGRGKYCSKKCTDNAKTEKVTVECATCGKKHKRSPSVVRTNNYCSAECAGSSPQKVAVKCDVCGKITNRPPSYVHDKNYCSRKCLNVGQRETIIIPCDNCGKTLHRPPSQVNNGGNYCCHECYVACNKGSDHTNWKGGVRLYRGKNWNTQRRKAYKRDGGVCQICGYHHGKKGKRRFVDVHHIKPFREFNDYKIANKLSNLICLCRNCHAKVEAGHVPCPQPLL